MSDVNTAMKRYNDYWSEDENARRAMTAHNTMVWLMVGYRLGGPWRVFAAAVVTIRHRGWRALA